MGSPLSTEAFFDSYAQDFNAIYGNKNTALNRFVNKHFRKSMRVRFDKSIEACDPIEGRSVVDIGAGPGHYGIALAQRSAGSIYALDFAKGMIDVAGENAQQAGVRDRFTLVYGDFLTHAFPDRYDYAIVMGFMDYMSEPAKVIEKVLSITKTRAVFSFPASSGILAWQRKLRYRSRCELYMYDRPQLDQLFTRTGYRYTVEAIDRDFFVTVNMQNLTVRP